MKKLEVSELVYPLRGRIGRVLHTFAREVIHLESR